MCIRNNFVLVSKERFEEAQEELEEILEYEPINDKPIVILSNKVDRKDATHLDDVVKAIGLDEIDTKSREAPIKIFETSVLKGMGIEEAFKWFKISAEQGMAFGMINVASFLRLGTGVEQDLKEAFKWYNIAVLSYKKMVNYRFADVWENEVIPGSKEHIREINIEGKFIHIGLDNTEIEKNRNNKFDYVNDYFSELRYIKDLRDKTEELKKKREKETPIKNVSVNKKNDTIDLFKEEKDLRHKSINKPSYNNKTEKVNPIKVFYNSAVSFLKKLRKR